MEIKIITNELTENEAICLGDTLMIDGINYSAVISTQTIPRYNSSGERIFNSSEQEVWDFEIELKNGYLIFKYADIDDNDDISGKYYYHKN